MIAVAISTNFMSLRSWALMATSSGSRV